MARWICNCPNWTQAIKTIKADVWSDDFVWWVHCPWCGRLLQPAAEPTAAPDAAGQHDFGERLEPGPLPKWLDELG